jgi:FhaA, N-terminal domain/FHA domain
MGPLRRFEKRLEKLFEGPFTKAFKGGVHPLEIARRLVREVDDGRVLGVNETMAPNCFQIYLGRQDYDRLAGFFETLGSEMEAMIITHANQKGYHLLTRPRLSFSLDEGLREGEFSIRTSLDEPVGVLPSTERAGTAMQVPSQEKRLGVLSVLKGDKAGRSFNLEAAKTRIGRSDENDIVLVDPRVSRFHAEVDRAAERYIIRDLGSTNGTTVRGRKVQERLLEDGDTLVIGGTEMRFGLV